MHQLLSLSSIVFFVKTGARMGVNEELFHLHVGDGQIFRVQRDQGSMGSRTGLDPRSHPLGPRGLHLADIMLEKFI